MECPSGCVLESVCDNNTSFIISSISIAFVGFCGGLICHIISLHKKLEENNNLPEDEVPPLYQELS